MLLRRLFGEKSTGSKFLDAERSAWLLCGRKRVERVLRLFSDSGAVLSVLSDEASMLSRLSRLSVPLFADWCVVSVVDPHGRYTPEGGHIAVRCFADDGHVVFQVQDDGIGIPTEALSRVFELFTQVDRSLDRSQGGLGIGLTVVRRLAEMQGGSVSADSEGLGLGSIFTVKLPLADLPTVDEAPLKASLARSRPRRILVVDDNVDTALSVATLLKLAGHTITLAHDGQAALAEAHATHPEVILLDIGLPGIDGYTVARTLRADEDFAAVRLMAVSGYGQPEDYRRSKEAGFDEHLVKPVEFAKLLLAIE